MAHSFVAYVDESGDEGFVFKDFPERASSEWFVLSALIIPTDVEMAQLRQLDAVIRPIEKVRQQPIHFAKLTHEQRTAVCMAIGGSAFRTVTIAVDKRNLQSDALKNGYALYFYATRYLLERVSWLARDTKSKFSGDGRVKITFSNRSRMSYDELRAYVCNLRDKQSTSIDWSAIDPGLIGTRQHKELVGLKAVDAVASGTRWALELSHYGYCEDRYVRAMESRIYRYKKAARSYGMKFFPAVPAIQTERANRYAWIDELCPK